MTLKRAAQPPFLEALTRFCLFHPQLDGGYDTVPCNTCSLCARVLYEVVEEEEEEGDAAQGEHR